MFITNKIGLKKFNFFNLSQITYGFSKAGHGSKEFWASLADNYANCIDRVDNTGIAILINSFGRSAEGRLTQILPLFKPLVLKNMPEFTIKQMLMILSGIATEASTKSKGHLEPLHYLPIFESFQ